MDDILGMCAKHCIDDQSKAIYDDVLQHKFVAPIILTAATLTVEERKAFLNEYNGITTAASARDFVLKCDVGIDEVYQRVECLLREAIDTLKPYKFDTNALRELMARVTDNTLTLDGFGS
jgi:geranylgeranyl pyrophosphate synthase